MHRGFAEVKGSGVVVADATVCAVKVKPDLAGGRVIDPPAVVPQPVVDFDTRKPTFAGLQVS